MIPLLDSIGSFFALRKHQKEERALTALKARYHAFRIFLENNGRALELIVNADKALHHGEQDSLLHITERLISVTGELVDGLNLLSGEAYTGLYSLHGTIGSEIRQHLQLSIAQSADPQYCMPFDDLDPSLYPMVGTKAANLAQLYRMRLPVPDGFVCTTRCCRDFLSSSDIADSIRSLLREVERGGLEIATASHLIRDIIRQAALPVTLKKALSGAFIQLERSAYAEHGDETCFAISVRSSGVAEDRPDHSFAGQFTSVLNVTSSEALFDAYKDVIASGFSARAIAYRINAGLSVADFDLGVVCQRMVRARCAGVMMTRNPAHPDTGRMLISAAPGLGTMAVGGSAPVDIYHPWRSDKDEPDSLALLPEPQRRYALLMGDAEIAHKTVREIAAPHGGLMTESVPADESDNPLLDAEMLQRLVMYGEMIESIEGMAQDVEWAVSQNGHLYLLQARPLRITTRSGMTLPAPVSGEPLATGICASAGKAAGEICLARNASDLQALDKNEGAHPRILVLPQALVDAARHLQRYEGVIVDSGNPTDHLSCIAREYGIPLVTSVHNGSSVLQQGQWVVLDADNGLIHPVPEHLWTAFISSEKYPAEVDANAGIEANTEKVEQPDSTVSGLPERPDKPDKRDLPAERSILWELLVPLNLTDVYGGTFSWHECRSLHDLVRYTHEMAVLAMFDAGDAIMEEAGGLLRPLDLGIPFHFLVIDLGGAVRRIHQTESSLLKRRVRNPLHGEDILSVPLAALCEGLLTPGLSWHSGPDPQAIAGIMSRTMLDGRGPRPAGSFNYALAARDYLNLNARVEFHFAMLDAVCGGDAQANYIRFRFKGGGAGPERGHRRVVFLRNVLEHNGFVTTVVGDLITASLTGASKNVVYERLVMVGRLLGFSRFLDGSMADDEAPVRLAENFLQGRYDSRTVTGMSQSNDSDDLESGAAICRAENG